MRLGMTLGVVSLCLLSSGCRLACDITSNLVFEARLCCDTVTSKVYYRHLANDAWKQYCAGHPEQGKGNTFGQGFRAGYADYLEGGGPVGCAPPLPPQCFWKCKYQNPEGRAATSAWFAGFKEGTAAAKASGYRDYVTVPIGKCDPPRPPASGPAHPPLQADVTPVTPPALRPGASGLPSLAPVAPVPTTPEQELPAPRQVPAPPAPAPEGSTAPGAPQGPEVGQRQSAPPQTPVPSSAAAQAGGPSPPAGGGSGSSLLLPPVTSPPVQRPAATEATITQASPDKGTAMPPPVPIMPAQLPPGGEATITVSPGGSSLTPWTSAGSGPGG